MRRRAQRSHAKGSKRRDSSTGVRRTSHRKQAWQMTAIDAAAERFDAGARIGWEAAMLEFEHQAEHWDTPEHGDTGRLIAAALRAAVEIARGGGLHCQHRSGAAMSPLRGFLAPSADMRGD